VKTKWHLATIGIGAALWYLLSSWITPHLPSVLSWYHYPFVVPVYFALLFGEGGENMNVRAGEISWVVESLLIGVLADVVVLVSLRTNMGRFSSSRF
jgi:hypothetical protein